MQRWLSGTLCLSALVLPFSIAAANTLFGLLLACSLLTGLWWQGAKSAYQAWPLFFHIWAGYFALMLLGMLWTPDVAWGWRIFPQYWAWLLLPVFVCLLQDQIWRNRFLIALSLGLFLQLLACVAQAFGAPLPVGNGSMAADPAGFIGHIGFGLIYGIWATWLIHWAHIHRHQHRWAWGARAVAGLSLLMVFVVQGRSGYIEALVLLMFVVWQVYLRRFGWRPLLWLLPALFVLLLAFSQSDGGKRMVKTVDSIRAMEQMDFSQAEERVSLMYAGVMTWWQHPWLGAGTGGYPVMAHRLQQEHPELGLHYTEAVGNPPPSSPHNFYIMMLARWGPVGLLLLLSMYVVWFRKGLMADWNHSSASMLSLSAIGIAAHAMTSLPFEEYYSTVFGMLWCSAGLAGVMMEQTTVTMKEDV